MTEDGFQALTKLKAVNFEAGLKDEKSQINFSIDKRSELLNENGDLSYYD